MLCGTPQHSVRSRVWDVELNHSPAYRTSMTTPLGGFTSATPNNACQRRSTANMFALRARLNYCKLPHTLQTRSPPNSLSPPLSCAALGFVETCFDQLWWGHSMPRLTTRPSGRGTKRHVSRPSRIFQRVIRRYMGHRWGMCRRC